MKPKIQLVGGCASPFVSEVMSERALRSGNDGSDSQAAPSGEAGVLLEQVLAIIIKAVDASAGLVRVLSPNGQELRTVGTTGMPGACQASSVVDAACGVCGKSASKHSIETSKVETCEIKYDDAFLGESCKYVLAVPFFNDNVENEPSGVLTLFFAKEQNNADSIQRILQSYAELIQVSLKSVWKNEDLHQSHLLDERQAIANEIHDSLAQTLYYAKIRASLLLDAMKSDNDLLAFKCAQDIDEALESSQKTVRELVTHFRCQMDPKGLKFALQKLVKDFVARTSIQLEYANHVEELELPTEYELQVFLIVRESLVNIASHSGATIAGLSVNCRDGMFQFVIEDNGGGVSGGEPPEGHHGLEIMRERALRIGGEVTVSSLEGQGTRVQLTFSAPVA